MKANLSVVPAAASLRRPESRTSGYMSDCVTATFCELMPIRDAPRDPGNTATPKSDSNPPHAAVNEIELVWPDTGYLPAHDNISSLQVVGAKPE